MDDEALTHCWLANYTWRRGVGRHGEADSSWLINWHRLIFAILRRGQTSLMDQSLAFCLFLSGGFSLSFGKHIFSRWIWWLCNFKDLPSPHLSSRMLGSSPFRQVKHQTLRSFFPKFIEFQINFSEILSHKFIWSVWSFGAKDLRFFLRSWGTTGTLWHSHFCKVSY